MTPLVNGEMPGVGSLAPDFTLASTGGGDVTLSEFRGKKNVLLAFFPLAFTGTCTKELCAFTDDFSQFASHDTVVLPISVDAIDSLREYRDKYQMSFELLSDFKREVSRLYGVLNDEKFYADRAYFVIDKNGTVQWAWREAKNRERRENAELLERLAALA